MMPAIQPSIDAPEILLIDLYRQGLRLHWWDGDARQSFIDAARQLLAALYNEDRRSAWTILLASSFAHPRPRPGWRQGKGRGMSVTHTPGLWKQSGAVMRHSNFDKANKVRVSAVNGKAGIEARDHLVAFAYGDSKDEARNNARLIAAAPELLEALRALMAWSDHPALTGLPDGKPVAPWAPSFDETVNMCHAAIAKAMQPSRPAPSGEEAR